VQCLGQELSGLRVVAAQATYLLWIDCSDITDDATVLCDQIRSRTGLVLSAGSSYGPTGARFLRMNLACPRSRLDDGLARLTAGIEP
jgi:cystathionine beta-lyase